MQVIAQQNDTIDLICHRHLKQTAGVTEQVLAMNPQLAGKTLLPMGTAVTLPDQLTPATGRGINLWD